MDVKKRYSLENRSLHTAYWKGLAWLGVALATVGAVNRAAHTAADMQQAEPAPVQARMSASGNVLPDIGGWFRSLGNFVVEQAQRSVVLTATVGVLATAGLIVAARRSRAKENRRARYYEAPAWEWEDDYAQADTVQEKQEPYIDENSAVDGTAAQVEAIPDPQVVDPWTDGLDRFRNWKAQACHPLQRLPEPMSEGQKQQQGTLYPSLSALEDAFEAYRERQMADSNA